MRTVRICSERPCIASYNHCAHALIQTWYVHNLALNIKSVGKLQVSHSFLGYCIYHIYFFVLLVLGSVNKKYPGS